MEAGAAMKLVATTVMVFSIFASEAAFAQTGDPSRSDAVQTKASQDAQRIKVTRTGEHALTKAPAEHFTGSATINRFRTENPPSRMSGASVAFEPGARTAWHRHPLGQILIVTAGTGWVQQWGDPLEEIHQGDVVWIPPGQKHWHGAAPNTSMAHIAVVEALDGKTVD